jgi:hypothetical protein
MRYPVTQHITSKAYAVAASNQDALSIQFVPSNFD